MKKRRKIMEKVPTLPGNSALFVGKSGKSSYKINENNIDYLPLATPAKKTKLLPAVLILGLIMIITVFFLRKTLKKYV